MLKPSLATISHISARLAAGLFLLVLVWSCANVPGLREEKVTSFIRVPFVRVLLQEGTDSLRFSGEGSFAIECLKSGEQVVYYSGRPVTVENRRNLLTVYNVNGDIIQENNSEINIIPRGASNRIAVNGKRYRGLLKVLPAGQSTSLINVIYMEDYLRGVVPPEIGPRNKSEIEAVKAQAIAARTYAMAHLRQYGNSQYDIKSSIIDQLYDGMRVENALVNRAIDATAGKVLFYGDEFVNAYYHSTCGGMTDNIENVWDRKELPYLRAVNDSSACSWSKYFTWKESFTEAQLRGRIEQYLSSDRGRDLRIGLIRDIIIERRTPGGRIEKLLIRTENNTFPFYKDRIRWVIGRTSNPDLILPSDRFDITLDRNSEGKIRTITFAGRGYGHGVGMCQCGAIGHARNGMAYDQILSMYYTDTDVKKLY